jgi:integrase
VHSFITLALRNGANLKDVSEIAGHHSEAFTLKVYAKASEAGKRAAVTRR